MDVPVRALAEVLRYVNLVVIAALAVAVARRWRAGAPGAAWVAVAFATLAALFASRITRNELPGAEETLLKVTAAGAVLFPYLLFRFSAALARPSRRTEVLVGAATILLLGATLALPDVSLREDPRPTSLMAYIVALLVQWAVVFAVVVRRLWRAGAGLANVARRRMRSLGFAAATLLLGVVLAGFGPGARPPGLDLAFRALVLVSVLAFFFAFAPPRFVRALWRQPEEDQLRRATRALMRATAPEDVVASVLPPMAGLVGARAVALLDADGTLLGFHGDPPAVPPLRLDLPEGSVLAWTSPYAPVFGDDELERLRTLGSLAGLALERARLFAQEREARQVLEQADELKSGFIALASHELRSPATAVYGLAELLEARAGTWPAERQAEFHRLLREQAEKLVHLIEQLLDISRLEAGAIDIRPQPVRIREHVEKIVSEVARERADDVTIDVEPELEAVVDPTTIERVVSNLVSNALRYGDAPIKLAAAQRDRHFRLAVEDRGAGVPREFVPHLFDRFARAERARATASGTGLGLSIAQSYAHAHGGRLLYHEAEPHGARFELVLPRGDTS
jgi:signal transduction histidine kinase